MLTSSRASSVLALALLAAACGEAPQDDAPDRAIAATGTQAPLDTTPPEQSTPATAAPSAMLVPDTLSEAEWRAAALGGELGCSFVRRAGEDPLLIAAADVTDTARGQAAVKIGGEVEKLTMDRAGGFNAMSRGARFTGTDGLAVDVAVTGSEPVVETPRVAMESPRYAATLTFARAGQTIALDGLYECGP